MNCNGYLTIRQMFWGKMLLYKRIKIKYRYHYIQKFNQNFSCIKYNPFVYFHLKWLFLCFNPLVSVVVYVRFISYFHPNQPPVTKIRDTTFTSMWCHPWFCPTNLLPNVMFGFGLTKATIMDSHFKC